MQQLADDFAGSGLKRSKAGVRHALKHEAVASLASDPRLLNIAQAILGSDAAPFRATLFDKSPEANWLVVWHQDTALPLQERRDVRGWGPWSMKEGIIYAHAPAAALCHVLALRVHLEDSSSHNGPLQILPGTHSKGVLSDADIEQLAIRIAPVECLVPQGGVIAMRPLVVHASSKSQSEAPRRVLHIEYAASKILADGLELAIG
ncbi:MAG: phytanoyl-CoA dioxygenase family protein [Terriglobales bacterium]